MTTKKIQFPRLISDEIEEISQTRKQFIEIKNTMMKNILHAWNEEWINRGGCIKCQGRQHIVVWDTMDSFSGCYAEFGSCPSCTDESREVGFNFAYYDSIYDAAYGTPDQRGVIYGDMFDSINNTIEKLSHSMKELENKRNRLEKGDIVCVVKGRKVPVGFVGKIFFIKDEYTRYGHKRTLGIKNLEEVVQWVNIDNVEIISNQSSIF